MLVCLQIEVLNPLNGKIDVSISNVGDAGAQPEDDAVVGLHFLKRQRLSGYCYILSFWKPNNVKLVANSLALGQCWYLWCWLSLGHALCLHVQLKEMQAWGALKLPVWLQIMPVLVLLEPGKFVLLVIFYALNWMEMKTMLYLEGECCINLQYNTNIKLKLHKNWVKWWMAYFLWFRKAVEVNLWDIEKCSKIWTAKPVSNLMLPHLLLLHNKFWTANYCWTRKSNNFFFYFVYFGPILYHCHLLQPPKNSLGIFTPTWFTSATFLTNDDHRKFAAGTNSHQVIFHTMLSLCLKPSIWYKSSERKHLEDSCVISKYCYKMSFDMIVYSLYLYFVICLLKAVLVMLDVVAPKWWYI